MNDSVIPFGPGGLTVIGLYIGSLLLVGYAGYRARREHSMRDFYLAGKGFGFFVLLLTLFATQYSGNTLLGFTGKTYRIGFSWMMCVHFMTAIIVFYLLFAPQLHRLAKRRGFITPTDFLRDRFHYEPLCTLATILMIVALSNYLLAQLMAMGRVLEGLTEHRQDEAYMYGVIFLAIIMVIYENLGGMRAVAWTDAIQGLILVAGLSALVVMIFVEFGSIKDATLAVMQKDVGRDIPRAAPPDNERIRNWFSYVLIVGMGGALYPQALQRIFAAKSERTLRRTLSVMAFLPLGTTLVAVMVGVMAIAHLPELESGTDRVLPMLCRQIAVGSSFGYWLVVVLFAAILAAVMSTADSAMLAISSMATKDLYGRFVRPGATDAQLLHFGKLFSWALIGVLVLLAILLRGTTLVELLDRKFDLLVQLAPTFMIGIHWRGMRARPAFLGMLVGVGISLGLFAIGYKQLWGFHLGLFGLVANLLITIIGSKMNNRDGMPV